MNNRINVLVAAIALSLAAAASAEEQEKKHEGEVKELEKIHVTGSLLPSAGIEGASPVLIITAEEIARNGFTNVADALKSTPFAVGSVRDSTPIGGGNAQSTKMINLFGLGPGFTKVLINGHPVANFPLSYNTGGGGNFTDLANIPMVMVERIEILPGSQSAIYGSDAISGVVNIILKQDVEGVNVSLRTGIYSDGGGRNQRLQVASGHRWNRTSLVYAVEHRKADPIIALDRELTALRPYNDDAYAYNNATGVYYDPGEAGCAQMAHLFGNSMEYRFRAGNNPFCGTDYSASFSTTFDSEREVTSGYLSLNHGFSDSLTGYVDLGYTLGRTGSNSLMVWYSDLVPTANGGYRVSRNFAPEELGGRDVNDTVNRTHQYDVALGLHGQIASSDWDFDVGYARSAYSLKQSAFLPLQQSMNNYLRARYYDISQVFVPLTPEEYAGFSARRTRKSETAVDQLTAKVINVDLFNLPGGAAGLALLAEAGRETWEDRPDDRYRANQFFGGAQQASNGDRDRYGFTAQLDMPLHDMLKLSTALRYDSYSYTGNDISSDTWRVGLEFRPWQSLLIRAAAGTSFQAPDMAYLYTGETFGNQNTWDIYQCDTLGVPRTSSACRYVMASYTSGNLDLQPVTAQSKSLGFVWSPSDRFSVNADYLDIEINDEVRNLSVPNILTDEASCRQGGAALALPSCDDALSRVIRDGSGRITRINGGYFNVAYKRMKTLMAGADYRIPTERWGDWKMGLSGSYILDFKQQNDAFSPVVDVIESGQGMSLFRSVINGSIGWEKGPVSATLYGVRYAENANFALLAGGWNSTQWGTPGRDRPWILYNASVRYRFDDDVSISVVVNNLRNSMPPNQGWTSYPNYNSQLYNVYGRALSMEFDYRF